MTLNLGCPFFFAVLLWLSGYIHNEFWLRIQLKVKIQGCGLTRHLGQALSLPLFFSFFWFILVLPQKKLKNRGKTTFMLFHVRTVRDESIIVTVLFYF